MNLFFLQIYDFSYVYVYLFIVRYSVETEDSARQYRSGGRNRHSADEKHCRYT